MRELSIKIPLGIGDAILISSALKAVKNRYSKININIDWSLINFKGNNKDYIEFYKNFTSLVFNDDIFTFVENSNAKFMNMKDLINIGIKPVLPRLSNVFSIDEIPVDGKYIVLTTKVRDYDKTKYNSFKQRFFDTINNVSKSYKIIVIGERVIEDNDEYKIHGNHKIYSIYEDIKSNINSFIDLSVPKLGVETPNLQNIKKDCTIMSQASAVITVGVGGNFVLALSVANRLISIRCDGHDESLILNNPREMFSTKNIDLFLKEIESL